MGRPLRVGLFSPYFGATYGGGEKYLALAARAVQDRWPAVQVDLIGSVPADAERYALRLGLDLSGLRLVATNRQVTKAHRLLNRASFLRPLRNRVVGAQASRLTREYDVFIAMAYVIPVRNQAARGAILCQFPYPLGSDSDLTGYQLVICQSQYVRKWVLQRWRREATVVYPPVEIPAEEPDWQAKRNSILSVGRFAAGGHDKRQDAMVAAFKRLCDAGLTGWRLHLAGSVHQDAHHAGHFEVIERASAGYPVTLHPDILQEGLQRLYREASIYWHSAGLGVDEEADPAALEHFGMTTVEAMGHGAVPVVIGRGGQSEIVRDGIDGFLWLDPRHLIDLTSKLVGDSALRRRLGESARERSHLFSREVFALRLTEALEPLLADRG